MQKKLIALAVAGLASGAAFAQTNVTMYGVADAGYVYSRGSVANGAAPGTAKPVFSGIQSGLLAGSRIGFRGEEALGNGLKAIFRLEYALNLDQNTGVGSGVSGLYARQQFVGLAGNWGQLTLGRQYAPGYDATVRNDSFLGAAFSPHSFLTSTAGNTITPNSGARWNNSVAYTSGNYGGFQAKAIYGFGEYSPTNAAGVAGGENNIWDDGKAGIGLNYANGPFNVDFVYQGRYGQRTDPSLTTVNGDDTNEWYLGGSFDFKFAKLMASYQKQNDKNAYNNDSNVWQVGAVIPVSSAGNIHLTYAQLNWDHARKTVALPGGIDGKTKSGGIAYSHGLSKRTTLYTGVVHVKNNNDSLAIAPGTGTGAVDKSNTTFVAGINHTF
ncbi:MAG: porin [Candidatus Accumulibacter sp.]|nr:porin [Accumulibacter sp.]